MALSRPRARLAAGWLSPRRRPARVTLRSCASASRNFSRFRSMEFKPFYACAAPMSSARSSTGGPICSNSPTGSPRPRAPRAQAGCVVLSAPILPAAGCVVSVGADLASGSGWIRMNRMLEQRLSDSIAATFARGLFMENWTPMIGQAVATGGLPSFLSPRDGASRWWRRRTGPGRRGVPRAGMDGRARDHRVRPAALCAKATCSPRWPPNWASRCGWIRWRRTAGPGRWRGGFFARGAGRIHRDDARPEQRAYRHGYGPRGGALGGSIPLAGPWAAWRGRFAARFPERVGAARADRNRRAWAASCFTTRYEAGFRKFLLIGLIYSMILNNPPERVFKREK